MFARKSDIYNIGVIKTGNKKLANNLKSMPKAGINLLPQNIVSMGGHVEENKNIYISQPSYKAVHKFANGKTVNESGGILAGHVIEEFGKTNIIITGFIEAKFCEATPSTLKFTHETWEYCHKQLNLKYPGQKIVGWIHTHPNFGIFLSEYDKFIQTNFFKEEYQTAYVIDPVQNAEGFYFWINGNIEKCKGFYIFDNTGRKITISDKNSSVYESSKAELHILSIKNIIISLLAAALILITFFFVSLKSEINILKQNNETITSNANRQINSLQQQVNYFQNIINEQATAYQEALRQASEAASSKQSVSSGESESSSQAESTYESKTSNN